MNIENRATKIYLKSLAPIEAADLIYKCKLPTPQKECLLALIAGKEGFNGCDYLADNFNINLGYWTYLRRLKEALQMFRKSVKYLKK